MKILALDLATNTGFAFNDGNDFYCGTWPLEITQQDRGQRLNRRNDPRIRQLYDYVHIHNALHRFDIVIIEDVEFQSYTLQCQLWSSLRAAAWLGAATAKFFEAVPVGTLKKFATGHGGATKAGMCRALTKQDLRFLPVKGEPEKVHYLPDPTTRTVGPDTLRDDNAVDAVWLWKWAKHNLGRIKV